MIIRIKLNIMKRNILSFLFLFLFVFVINTKMLSKEYDVVVYGATSAGISAAIQCSRMHKTVLLIEPSHRIGGLTTGGLGATDIGSKIAIGGISKEFYQLIKKYYDQPKNWKWQDKADYRESTNIEREDAMR